MPIFTTLVRQMLLVVISSKLLYVGYDVSVTTREYAFKYSSVNRSGLLLFLGVELFSQTYVHANIRLYSFRSPSNYCNWLTYQSKKFGKLHGCGTSVSVSCHSPGQWGPPEDYMNPLWHLMRKEGSVGKFNFLSPLNLEMWQNSSCNLQRISLCLSPALEPTCLLYTVQKCVHLFSLILWKKKSSFVWKVFTAVHDPV